MIKTRRIACIAIRIHHEYINVCFGPFLAQIRGNLRLMKRATSALDIRHVTKETYCLYVTLDGFIH